MIVTDVQRSQPYRDAAIGRRAFLHPPFEQPDPDDDPGVQPVRPDAPEYAEVELVARVHQHGDRVDPEEEPERRPAQYLQDRQTRRPSKQLRLNLLIDRMS